MQEREAALTHVSIRDAELGWRHITPNEASKLFPNEPVSANDRVFMCELCGQYVTFVNSRVYQRFFKHSKGEENKNCEERIRRSNKYPPLQTGRYLLPLKIVLHSDGRGFSLSIGIPRANEFDADAQVLITGKEARPHIFALSERMQDGGISWLNLGQDINNQYTVLTKGFRANYWPDIIPGINPDGAVFDSTDGKMLYPGDEVVEKHTYYLLTDSMPPYCDHILCSVLSRKTIDGKIWQVYQVRVDAFSPDTVRYFLLLHMRLVKRPVSLTLLWPSTVRVQGTSFHNGNALYVAHNGGKNLQLMLFPSGQGSPKARNGYFCVTANGFQQMAAVQYHNGQQHQSYHTMLWQGALPKEAQVPTVVFSDSKGAALTEAVYTKLPVKNLLEILTLFDGEIVITHGNHVVDIQNIRADEAKTLEVSFGETVKVLQGKDIAGSISFERPHQEKNTPFVTVLLQLLRQPTTKYVPVRHSMGNVIRRIPMSEELKQELYFCVRRGKIPTEAYRYLTDYLTNHT